MRRVLEITWGVVLLLVSSSVLSWIVYSYTVAKEPPRYPWWWAVILVAAWSYASWIGVKRVRGRRAP